MKGGTMAMRPGHHTTGHARVIWLDESLTLHPTSGRVYSWRTPKGAHNAERLVPKVKFREGSVIVWAGIS
jgi:hypothetical protein